MANPSDQIWQVLARKDKELRDYQKQIERMTQELEEAFQIASEQRDRLMALRDKLLNAVEDLFNDDQSGTY